MILFAVLIVALVAYFVSLRSMRAAYEWGRQCAQEIWARDLMSLGAIEGIKFIDPNKRFLSFHAHKLPACVRGFLHEMAAIDKATRKSEIIRYHLKSSFREKFGLSR